MTLNTALKGDFFYMSSRNLNLLNVLQNDAKVKETDMCLFCWVAKSEICSVGNLVWMPGVEHECHSWRNLAERATVSDNNGDKSDKVDYNDTNGDEIDYSKDKRYKYNRSDVKLQGNEESKFTSMFKLTTTVTRTPMKMVGTKKILTASAK